MALGTKLKWVVAFAALGLAATPAIAQQQTKCTDDRQCFTGACVDGVCKATDAKLDVITPAKLSTQEQVAYGELLMQRIEGVAASIGKQLRVTREGRDVVKSLCLNDKLNQVDVAKRTAKDRQAALKAAAQAALDTVNALRAAQSKEVATHEFTILLTIQRRVEQLASEGNSCVGQEDAFLGVSKVVETRDNNLAPPSRETEFPPTDPTVITEVPKCTSCVR